MRAAIGRYCLVAALVTLAATSATVSAAAQRPGCFGRQATIVAQAGVPTIGTSGDDVIVGTNGPDDITGGGGDDRLCGRGGADTIRGNAGRDRIRAGGGNDLVQGGPGADLIFGGSGDDRLVGGSGNDTVRGRRGRDTVLGGPGNDALFGNQADDRLVGGSGNDRLNGGLGTDSCFGSNGRDSTSACELVDVPKSTAPGPRPIGAVDSVRSVDGGIEVVGWMLDVASSATWIQISADDRVVGRLRPSEARLDVRLAHPNGPTEVGFRAVVDAPPGTHTLCVDAVRDRSKVPVRLGCGSFDRAAADSELAGLETLLRELGTTAEAELKGSTVALAVVALDRGVLGAYRGERLFVSASTAKAWWTAAALANGEARAASALAPAVFQKSSDAAAGAMIDLAGGIDVVNDFTLGAGMTDTAVLKWTLGGTRRRSRQAPGRLGTSNYVDASDAAMFFYKMGTYQVLDPPLTDLLAGWMRLAPRDVGTGPPEASMIPDSLPPRVKDTVRHKAGWLPVGSFSVPGHLLDVGIVEPANGSSPYALALMGQTDDTAEYRRLIEFFQSASCQVYRHVAADETWRCPAW